MLVGPIIVKPTTLREAPPGQIAGTGLVNRLIRQINSQSIPGVGRIGNDVRVHSCVHVKVTSGRTAKGWYNGYIAFDPTNMPDGNTDLVSSQLASYAITEDTIIAALADMNSTVDHPIMQPTNQITEFLGLFLGLNSDEKNVVVIDGITLQDC